MFRDRLRDKVAIITGAASGIGAATAQRFAAEGARLLMIDKSPTVQDHAYELGAQALVIDIARHDAGKMACEEALRAFGGIDILVNIAGIGGARPLLEMDDNALDRMIEINLTAVMRMTRAVIPHLTSAGGRIINTASTLGLTGYPGTTAYSVAKAGVAHLTRQLAGDLGPHGITINAVAPGAIETPLTRERILGDEAYKRAFIESCPLRRPGKPDEVAAVFAFLASDEASYISGQVIAVDGGWLASRSL